MNALPLLLLLGSTGEPSVLGTKVVSASMFKNGYALVTREATVDRDGKYFIDDFGQGVLGTVWIGGTTGVRIKAAKATDRKVTISTDVTESARSTTDVLRINTGKLVTLSFGKEEAPVTGTIQQVIPDNVALKVGAKSILIPIASIRRVSAPTGLNFERKVVDKKPGLRRSIELDIAAAKGGRVTFVALERGLTWAPSYSLTLQRDGTLVLDSKALVLNDLVDLNGASVRFVTGFPNVEFLSKLDPFTTPMNVDQFLSTLMNDSFVPQASMMMNQAAGFGGGGARGPGGPPGAPVGTQGSGEATEDLFFYSQPGVDLRRGERGYYSVMRTEVPFERVFVWDVSESSPMVRPEYSPTPQTPNEDVWSTIRFVNKGKMPLTTGPATTFADGQMIGQSLLKYTSIGEEAQVKLTKALDVRADALEEETERVRGALNLYGTVFDLVTVKGTLQATNRKSEKVKLVVVKTLVGDLLSASGEAVKSKTTRGLRDLNGGARVEWTETIEPGKKIELTYTYRAYTRT